MIYKPHANPNDPSHPGYVDPEDYGPAWDVIEGDRHVVHVIGLAEIMGLYEGEDYDDRHRTVARNYLRKSLFRALADSLTADAFENLLDDHGPFDRTVRLIMGAAGRLVEHGPDYETGVAPTTALLEITRQHLPEDRRRRCGKSRDSLAHGYAKIGSALEDLVIVARERLAAKSELQASGLQWKMYDEPKGPWAGFLIDPSREPGPEAVAYWLKSDGSVVEPTTPGPPAGYPQRGFGNL